MTGRGTATALALAVLVTVALPGDADGWTTRTALAAHERAVEDAGRAVGALTDDAAGTGSLGAAQSAAAASALAATARTALTTELDTARAQLADDTTTPAAARATLEAEVEVAAAVGPSVSPATLTATTARVREARLALVAAREVAQAAAQATAPTAVATQDATATQSCASTYTGPPFYTSEPTVDGDGSNGHLPASAMTALSWSVDDLGTPFYLRSDAATALERLNIAFTAAFGHPLDLDLTYRDYDTQVAMRAALGTIAAVPGTSTHGTGLAIDVPELPCSYGWDTPARDWLLQHGPEYGWVSPSWARESGSNPEYWHYEYRG